MIPNQLFRPWCWIVGHRLLEERTRIRQHTHLRFFCGRCGLEPRDTVRWFDGAGDLRPIGLGCFYALCALLIGFTFGLMLGRPRGAPVVVETCCPALNRTEIQLETCEELRKGTIFGALSGGQD